MHTEVEPIVTRLQQDVPAAEARIDDAMIALLSLTTSVVAARRDTAGVPAAKGHAMIQRLAKAQMSLPAPGIGGRAAPRRCLTRFDWGPLL